MKQRFSRRTFLKTASLAATVTLLPPGLARTYAANEKVSLASLGWPAAAAPT